MLIQVNPDAGTSTPIPGDAHIVISLSATADEAWQVRCFLRGKFESAWFSATRERMEERILAHSIADIARLVANLRATPPDSDLQQ